MRRITHALRMLLRKRSRPAVVFFGMSLLLRPVDHCLRFFLSRTRSGKTASQGLAHPPIFIIGPPRSGSTLVYQYLAQVLDVNYITNAWALFPRSGRYLFPRSRHRTEDFNSFYGNSAKLHGLQEGGSLFDLWFDGEHHHAADEMDPDLAQHMRSYFETVSEVGEKPWLVKNGRNAVRIKVLKEVFPEAVFVYLRRDPLFIAQSIIEGRVQLTGDVNTNWTVKPREWPELESLPYPQQVARQVAYIEQAIEQDLLSDPNSRVVEIDYPDFCAQPYAACSRIREAFPFIHDRPGLSAEVKEQSFRVSSDLRLDTEVLDQVRAELDRLEASNGSPDRSGQQR